MNHFEVVELMRQKGAEKDLTEIAIDIDWQGTVCQGGQNVTGIFVSSTGKETHMFWDAAFQKLEISHP